MSNVLDVAARSKTSRGYTVLRALPAFPQHIDTDGYTRVWAERESDEALMVVFARGAVRDIIDVHNTRTRLQSEITAARKVAADKEASDDERSAARAQADSLTEERDSLPKTKAQALLHVARSMRVYESGSVADSPDPGEDVGETE